MAWNIEDIGGVPGVQIHGLNTAKNVDFSAATSVALPAGTTIAGTTAAGLTTITSTSASALTVGANGATNPVLKINANTASVATGITVVGAAAAGGVAVSAISSGSDENLTIDAKGSGTITLNGTGTGLVAISRNATVAGTVTVTSASASALTVGRLGATTPALQVDASTATSITGLKIKSAAAGNGLALSAVGEASNGNLTVDAQGSGTISLNVTGTGNIVLGRAATGVSLSTTGLITSRNATAVAAAASVTPAFLTSSTALLGLYVGTGSPNTALTAAQGSLYLRADGSSTSTRAYINTDGSTAWAAVTTAS